jgi:hypothetical protein
MKFIHLLLLTALLSGCSHPGRVFTPTDPSAIGSGINTTQKTIHEAKTKADAIYQRGTAPRSPEADQLRLTLTTAEGNAAQAQKALDDFKRADVVHNEQINAEVKTQTTRAVNAEAKVQAFQPHLMRLRELTFVALFLGALLMWGGPRLATLTGYGAAIQAIPIIGGVYDLATGIAAVLAGAALLTLFLTLAGLFGYL